METIVLVYLLTRPEINFGLTEPSQLKLTKNVVEVGLQPISMGLILLARIFNSGRVSENTNLLKLT